MWPFTSPPPPSITVRVDQLVVMEDGSARIEGLHVSGDDHVAVGGALSMIMAQLEPHTTTVLASEDGEPDFTRADGRDARTIEPGEPEPPGPLRSV